MLRCFLPSFLEIFSELIVIIYQWTTTKPIRCTANRKPSVTSQLMNPQKQKCHPNGHEIPSPTKTLTRRWLSMVSRLPKYHLANLGTTINVCTRKLRNNPWLWSTHEACTKTKLKWFKKICQKPAIPPSKTSATMHSFQTRVSGNKFNTEIVFKLLIETAQTLKK